MSKASFISCAALFLAATSAQAAPATRVEVLPSAIFIYATNPDERSYNCSVSFVWSHDDFGTRKSQSVSTVVGVNPKVSNAIIFQLSGSYVRVQIEGSANISCT